METKAEAAPKKPLTIAAIRAEIARLDPKLATTDDAFGAALLLLAALNWGTTDAGELEQHTQLPHAFVEKAVARCLDQGLFTKDGKIAGAEWFAEGGGIAFWLDVSVVLGFVGRAVRHG